MGVAKQPWIPTRYVFCILSFLGMCNLYAVRVNLSVAIIAMVNNTPVVLDDNATSVDVCPVEIEAASSNISTDSTKSETFDWDSTTQGIILGSFFYGYVCTQIFGGWISQRYGAKHLFGCAVLISGILALLTPIAAKWNYQALIATRILQGLFQGVCFPLMHTMMGQWAPPQERSRMVTFSYSGTNFGTVSSLIISGILSEKLGWESVFYFFGGTSVCWYFFWYFFAFDSPKTHPRIGEEEKNYILNSIGTKKADEKEKLPLKKLFKSLPFWAICVGNAGHNWGFFTLLTNIPTFLSKILHFNLKTNGILSALPYIAIIFVMQISAFFADFLRKRKILSTTSIRRSFHFVGQLIPSICLVTLGYIGCDVIAAVALLTLAVGLDGIATVGFQVNHVDISPTHAGLLMGISNTFGVMPGVMGPYVVGLLTSGPLGQTITQWRLVFFISAAVYMTTATFYACFASGELESWEKRRPNRTDSGLQDSPENEQKLIALQEI